MHRPNDATHGQNQQRDVGEWKSVAQEAWAPDHRRDAWTTNNRDGRSNNSDNDDIESELNHGLNFNIFDQSERSEQPQARARNELHSGVGQLDRANTGLNQAIRALSNGDSSEARRYLIRSMYDIGGGVNDLRDGLRLNPDDSRQDRRGERNVRGGIDEIGDSQSDLRKALRLLNEGNESEALKFLRKGKRDLKEGREEIGGGVSKIEDANRHRRGGRHGGCEPPPPAWEPREPKAPCEPGEPRPPYQPREPKPPCEPKEPPTVPPCEPKEPPTEPPCEPKEPPTEPPCEPKEPPTEPPCEPKEPPTEPPCEPKEPPAEPPCEPKEPPAEPPCEPKPPLYDNAERHLIWGDPHIRDEKGNDIENQIEANRNVLLIKTIDGASITGHTASFNNPELSDREGHDITVFDREVVNLGDGNRILFNSDGTANRVDANGNIGEAMQDNETITSTRDSNDKVTYDAETRTLSFSFVGDDKSTIAGVLTGNIDGRGNYINSEVKESGGLFGGFMPALKADFTGLTVDSQTGAGSFDPDQSGRERTNEDFFIDSLYI